YATWNLYFIFIPLVLCTITYIGACAMRTDVTQSRRPMGIGIGLIVLILAICKYRIFLLTNLAFVLPWLQSYPVPAIFMIGLPLGISFYSFEAISYLLDTRQGKVPSATFMDLCLFIMFWPHLIAGPIVRSRELIPQFKFHRPF